MLSHCIYHVAVSISISSYSRLLVFHGLAPNQGAILYRLCGLCDAFHTKLTLKSNFSGPNIFLSILHFRSNLSSAPNYSSVMKIYIPSSKLKKLLLQVLSFLRCLNRFESGYFTLFCFHAFVFCNLLDDIDRE